MFRFARQFFLLCLLAPLSGCDRLHRPFGPPPKIAVGRFVIMAPPGSGGANPDASLRNALDTQLQLRDLLWVGTGERSLFLTGGLKVEPAPNGGNGIAKAELVGAIDDGKVSLERKSVSLELSNGLDEAAYGALAEALVNAFFPPPDTTCYGCGTYDTVSTTSSSDSSTNTPAGHARRQNSAPPRAVTSSLPRSQSSGGTSGEHAVHTSKPPANPVAASVPRSHPTSSSSSSSTPTQTREHRRH